jgi:uncharacterized protein (DUF885 family)
MKQLNVQHCSLVALFILGPACTRAPRTPAGAAPDESVSAMVEPPSKQVPSATAESQLAALFEQDWLARRDEQPSLAAAAGERRYRGRWDDESPAAYEHRRERLVNFLTRLRPIHRPSLSAASQLDYELFQRGLELELEGYEWGVQLLAVSNLGGPQDDGSMAELLDFESLDDFSSWNDALEAYPVRIEQLMELLEEGIARRIVPPKAAMRHVSRRLAERIVSKPEESTFYEPYRRERPETIAAAAWQGITERARHAISERTMPALERFRAFFDQRYFPAGYDADGAWQLPDGEARYAYQVRLETSTRLTPSEVHALGLQEVARIREQMLGVLAETGFSGSLEQFFEFLRTDSRFYGRTADEILARYAELVQRAEEALPRAFRSGARGPLSVLPVPASWADAAPAAIYRSAARDGSRAAALLVNTSHPETRPTWDAPTLALHEGVPGHHLQISIERALPARPRFRDQGEYGAYAEGWALYAESVGGELGLLPDAYARFGKLASEMWRAIRLVLDTGMHAKRWDRAQAMRYFRANCPRPESDITFEVERYVALPGSALAYKLGELSISRLRRHAQEVLGARWDLAAFHEAILAEGRLPLDVLERRLNAWIDSQASRRL